MSFSLDARRAAAAGHAAAPRSRWPVAEANMPPVSHRDHVSEKLDLNTSGLFALTRRFERLWRSGAPRGPRMSSNAPSHLPRAEALGVLFPKPSRLERNKNPEASLRKAERPSRHVARALRSEAFEERDSVRTEQQTAHKRAPPVVRRPRGAQGRRPGARVSALKQ